MKLFLIKYEKDAVIKIDSIDDDDDDDVQQLLLLCFCSGL
jgi:hypothetical protein